MITALQNFISRKGKIFFILLLFVVVVSFVLYLAQGSSVFDLLPNPNKQTEEFYGYDLNDPDQMRSLGAQNRVASDFGMLVGPTGEVMEKADRNYQQFMQAQLQRMFASGSQDPSRTTQLQYLFQALQSWPYQPKRTKVRRIAMAGAYDPEFFQASLRAKLVMDGQAEAWGLLPLGENVPAVNDFFLKFLGNSNPFLQDDDNRTQAFRNVGRARGFGIRGVETVLYSYFRASMVDDVYHQAGYVLDEEARIDLRMNDFAWDAESLVVSPDDLNFTFPPLFGLKVAAMPKAGESLQVSYDGKKKTFVFVDQLDEINATDRIQVPAGKSPSEALANLSSTLQRQDLGFSVSQKGAEELEITPLEDRLPQNSPVLSSSSSALSVEDRLSEELMSFHEKRKNDEAFSEPARTFAVALTFRTEDFRSEPEEPSEAFMRTHFEDNKAIFAPPPPPPPTPPPSPLPLPQDGNGTALPAGPQGPVGPPEANASDPAGITPLSIPSLDLNGSVAEEVRFEDVREEVRQRIIEGRRIDAERLANDLARDSAFEFLVDINELGDKLGRKYNSNYEKIRKSPELLELLAKSGAHSQKIDFSEKDMGARALRLGLERRESEKRSNREPLLEVASLNEKLFFTRSVRKSRAGYTVFIFDRKTPAGPGIYGNASFADLYGGYASELKSDAFAELVDQTLDTLQGDENASFPSIGNLVEIKRRGSRMLEGYYEGLNARIGAKLRQLEEERGVISAAERESNATPLQLARKGAIDEEIENIRSRQAQADEERAQAERLSDACPGLSPDGKWTELERTAESATFVRLKGVYTSRGPGKDSSERDDRGSELQFARAELVRDLLLRDLMDRELSEEEED